MPKEKDKKMQPWQDPRLDPRQKPILQMMAEREHSISSLNAHSDLDDANYPSWHDLMLAANTKEALEQLSKVETLLRGDGNTEQAPLEGLIQTEGTYPSDGHDVPWMMYRPEIYSTDEKVPVVFYIHGGESSNVLLLLLLLWWSRTLLPHPRRLNVVPN